MRGWSLGRADVSITGVGDFEEISLTLSDGYEAYARYWSPKHPAGAVLYLHGIQSHCGWYEASARRLRDAGYAVLQPDRRGSGRNARDRGHAASPEQLLSDVSAARDALRMRSGKDGYHLLGVSWGGKLAVAAYVADGAGVQGLTLVTPGLFPLVGVTPAEKFRIGVAMVTDPCRRFDIPLNDAELFTAHRPKQRFIDADPLTLRQATAAFYLASRRLDRTCARLGSHSPAPVHLLLAGQERIIDNARTEAFIRDLNWPGTRVTRYDAARHSLEFEADPEPFLRDVVTWIHETDAQRLEANVCENA